MTDLEILHHAILTNPDLDLPRRQYADVLIESGEGDCGEFVRLQLDFEKLDSTDRQCPWINNYGHEDRRWKSRLCECAGCESVLAQYALWRAGVWAWHNVPRGGSDDVRFERHKRGFVDKIVCTWQEFLLHVDALIWRPGAKIICSCGGGYWTSGGMGVRQPLNCHLCSGSGWVVSSMPPATAQPITSVAFTTWPSPYVTRDGSHELYGERFMVPRGEQFDHSRRGIVGWLLKQRWPSVRTWGLPTSHEVLGHTAGLARVHFD